MVQTTGGPTESVPAEPPEPVPSTPYVQAGADPHAVPHPPSSRGVVTGPDRLPPRPPYRPLPPEPAPLAPPPAPPRRRTFGDLVGAFTAGALGALLVVALLLATGVLPPRGAATAGPGTTVVERVTRQIVTPEGGTATVEAVAAKVVPSIVTVEVGKIDTDGFAPFASGSGVIISADGLIVTNHHVIQDAEASRVTLQDGRTYDATILGSDAQTDLAVLRVATDGLTPVVFGSTQDLAIGATAIAVGNPLGQKGGASVTAGIISAFNREVDFGNGEFLFGMLQTDAPITRGSSGGGLVDGDGRLIGITTAIGVSDAGAEGIGYATPVEMVRRITDEIIETGEVRHAFLGIQGQDHIAEAPDGARYPAGAEVGELYGENLSAETAGLRPGDVIVAIDGETVTTMDDLIIAIRLHRVGDAVTLRVRRGTETFTTTAVLGERPPDA